MRKVGIGRSAICLRGKERVSPPICRRCPSACDMFALSFAKKAIGSAGSAGKPGNIFLGIIPKDINYRPPSLSPTLVGRLVAAAPRCHTGVPFTKCHGKAADAEWLREVYLVLRPFVGGTSGFAILRPHQEITCGDHDHFWTKFALLEVIQGPQRSLLVAR